jgi:hypothetical protein
MHDDTDGRDSLSLDVVEVLRPYCDAIVWEKFQGKFQRTWCEETTIDGQTGVCRLKAPYTHGLTSDVHGLMSKLQPALTELVDMLTPVKTEG